MSSSIKSSSIKSSSINSLSKSRQLTPAKPLKKATKNKKWKISSMICVTIFIKLSLTNPQSCCYSPPYIPHLLPINFHSPHSPPLPASHLSSTPPHSSDSTQNTSTPHNSHRPQHVRIPCAKYQSRCPGISGMDAQSVSATFLAPPLFAPLSLPSDRTGLFIFFTTSQVFSSCFPCLSCLSTLKVSFLIYGRFSSQLRLVSSPPPFCKMNGLR